MKPKVSSKFLLLNCSNEQQVLRGAIVTHDYCLPLLKLKRFFPEVGVLIFATIVGNIGSMITNMGAARYIKIIFKGPQEKQCYLLPYLFYF